jgi:hypothetical protein
MLIWRQAEIESFMNDPIPTDKETLAKYVAAFFQIVELELGHKAYLDTTLLAQPWPAPFQEYLDRTAWEASLARNTDKKK